jgi:hypothetical protein
MDICGTSASSSSRIKQSALYGDPWDDELAYDRDDIADKFRTFACHPIAADKLEEAIEHAWSLRDGGDVRSLMRAVG